jgi:phage-related protein
MIQIPFLIGAAIGAGVTLYLKRSDKAQSIVGTLTDGVKNGAEAVSGAATTTVDTVKSTVETIKEKTADKKAAREKIANDDD